MAECRRMVVQSHLRPAAGYDARLAPLLSASTPAERDAALAQLGASAAGLIETLARRAQRRSGLSSEDVDDLRSTVMLKLMQRLAALGHDVDAEPLSSFDDFVAVIAFHAVNDLMRKRHPERAALKNRIRYALEHDHRLALRGGERTSIAALAASPAGAPVARVPSDAGAGLDIETADTAEMVHLLLQRIGGPVELDALVDLACELVPVARHSDNAAAALETVADPAPPASRLVEARQSLARLWSEILQLPRPQRLALLLGMREAHGVSAIPMLIFSGIATLDDVAAALALTRRELEDLWDALPLDDETIALRLGLRRQQVTSLRKTARERLARRRAKGRF